MAGVTPLPIHLPAPPRTECSLRRLNLRCTVCKMTMPWKYCKWSHCHPPLCAFDRSALCNAMRSVHLQPLHPKCRVMVCMSNKYCRRIHLDHLPRCINQGALQPHIIEASLSCTAAWRFCSPLDSVVTHRHLLECDFVFTISTEWSLTLDYTNVTSMFPVKKR